MKKIILIATSLFCCVAAAVAQNYNLRINYSVMNNNNDVSCGSHVRLTFHTKNGTTWEWYQEYNMNYGDWRSFNKTFPVDGDDPVIRVDYESKRYTQHWSFGWHCDDRETQSGSITINTSDYPCSSASYNGRFATTDNFMTITVRPQNGTAVDYTENGTLSTSNILPLDNIISLSAHTAPKVGVDASGYGWQYKIGTNDWSNLPSTFGSASAITFSGRALFNALGIDPQLHLFKNIFFQAIYTGCVDGYTYECLRYEWVPCTDCKDGALYEKVCVESASNPIYGEKTATYTLRLLPSSPHIVSVEPIQETCHDFQDAQLRVHFDRPLYANENLTIFKKKSTDTGVPEALGIATLDADNISTLENLAPNASGQTYDISLLSTFHSPTNVNVSLGVGYSNGTNHFGSAYIKPRDQVSFTATPQDVHCYSGQDGKIIVTAAGGTNLYTASLFNEASPSIPITSCDLTNVTSNSFSNLPKEKYIVRLTDSHGCIYKLNGNEVIQPAPVNEPLTSVVLSTVEAIEPLGFGLQNGHITVRAQSGTNPYIFEWTNAAQTTFTADPSEVEGASMKSTLSNIGKDVYHIIAKDNQYALAFPQTEVNLRGCYDTLTIVMDQPPLLEVKIRETHYVSCFGSSDGELMAHANGGRPYLQGSPNAPYVYEWYTVAGNNLTGFGESDSTAFERPALLYRIKVTDRNGIIAWSPDFMLVQPDALKLTFNTSQLRCNGDTNGKSEVLPQGGTMPYRFAWSTEESTSHIENLTDGTYSVVVTDKRKCTTFGQTEVTVPNSLVVEANVVQPVCQGDANGSVALTVSGGVPAYSYTWNQGAQTAAITSLAHGTYSVHIKDSNGCFLDREYSLENPDLFPINLGTDRVLCKDQTLSLTPVIDHAAATYTWKKDNVLFATTPAVELVDAGTYTLQVTDSKGCSNGDDITISRSDVEIAASLVVATRVPVGGKVHVANISYPSPDRTEWIIPNDATVLEQQPEYLELMFATKGAYAIGIKSYKGTCEKTSFSDVKVVGASELADYKTPDEPFIRQFSVTPNPNDGKFTVTVELKEVANFRLLLYANQSSAIMQDDIIQQSFLRKEYDVSAQAGTGLYILQLITAQGQSVFKLMINK